MKLAGRIAFVVLVPLFIVYALLAPELRSAPRSAASRNLPLPVSISEDSTTVSPPHAFPRDDDGRSQGDVETDLYGNDVSDAVAEYGLDAAGSLYELHAPQVELPHLGSPKS